MEIICENCGNKAIVPEEKLPDKPVKITCKKCGASFTVSRPKKRGYPEATVEKLPNGKLKVKCPACETAHLVDPAKIPSGKIKGKCKKCGEPFIFEYSKRRKPPPPPPPELSEEFFRDTVAEIEETSGEANFANTADVGQTAPEDELGSGEKERAREPLLPIGVNAHPKVKKKKREGYYIIDEEGNENGPLDIIMLRNWARSGQIESETLVLTPDGDNTVAGRIEELKAIFESIEKQQTPAMETQEAPYTIRDFGMYLAGGGAVGIIFGLVLAILAAIFGPGFIPFAEGGTAVYSWKSAGMILLINLIFGLFIGLTTSIIFAINKTNNPEKEYRHDEMPGIIGASAGGLIALIALLSNNAGMFGAIGLVLYLYVMGRLANFIRNRISPAGEQVIS